MQIAYLTHVRDRAEALIAAIDEIHNHSACTYLRAGSRIQLDVDISEVQTAARQLADAIKILL